MTEDEHPLLGEEEEEIFGEWLWKLLEHVRPNPDRTGCPAPQIIRDIAFHRKVDERVLDEVISHIMECDECIHDARACADEYRKTAGK